MASACWAVGRASPPTWQTPTVDKQDDTEQWLDRAKGRPVARLGTVSARHGAVDLVPVTFVIHDGCFVTAVDHKPKSTRRLARLDNVAAAGTATALIDQWDEDWDHLWWVRLRGFATVVTDLTTPSVRTAVDALVAKYPQYCGRRPAGPVIRMRIDEVKGWHASGVS